MSTPTPSDPARRRHRLWWLWLALMAGLGAYAAWALSTHQRADEPLAMPLRVALLPGQTTHAHHQIEMACASCHGDAFGQGPVLQNACINCHGKALEEANDKHPARKFEDPRNAFRLEKIDALQCVTCHAEHKPQMTLAMGVTQPKDFCFHCHAGPEEMPPSHKDFDFEGCTDCHNYHDNRALYEDFLLKHASDPAIKATAAVPGLDNLVEALQGLSSYPAERFPFEPLSPTQADAPTDWAQGALAKAHAGALDTSHARAGVNCSACHLAPPPEGQLDAQALARWSADSQHWIRKPSMPQACVACHADEVKGFTQGLHGMRQLVGLDAMRVGDARLPMKASAGHQALSCVSCHGSHEFNTGIKASVDACMTCHNDQHTRSFKDSPHFALMRKELAGELPAGSGVTCATCHMPRERFEGEFSSRIGVQHNQSATMRPFSKMARPVCMSCHGLGFSLDALSDPALVARNFTGQPAAVHKSIQMAVDKDIAFRERRAAEQPNAP